MVLVDTLGEGAEEKKCVPFVSQYTDCTDENKCDGCTKCTCLASGEWSCQDVHDCVGMDSVIDERLEANDIDTALMMMQEELQAQKIEEAKHSRAPHVPSPDNNDQLLLEPEEDSIDDAILKYMRDKRSVEHGDNRRGDNNTIVFHHVTDELDEDTLKSTNLSGTIAAAKVDSLPQASRRAELLNNSTSKSLQIEYTPPNYSNHIADNKVDTSVIHDDKLDLLVHHQIPVADLLKNKTKAFRDKELSKILVNELKGGTETIGDKNAPIISNVTFTPENDTLTAMAFIAGNLLNHLWNLEKDASDNDLEIETMKHKKVADLLELFKEPLNLRQESFLKNALEHLSSAIEKKDLGNISLCEKIEELKRVSNLNLEPNTAEIKSEDYKKDEKFHKNNKNINNKGATEDAVTKIKNVLDLIKRYENSYSEGKPLESDRTETEVRKSLDYMLNTDEKSTLTVFGNLLQTLTKLIIPNKKGHQIAGKIKNVNLFTEDKDFKTKLESSGIDLRYLNVSAKDRIVFDYLNHIQKNPNCLLSKQNGKVSVPSIEGNILLNLSEFFKIKSMSDLLKMVETDKKFTTTTLKDIPTTTTTTSTTSTTSSPINLRVFTTEHATQPTTKDYNRFEATKNKLKTNLKLIFDNLLELQRLRGKPFRGKKIDITDVLPCIYNTLFQNKAEQNVADIIPLMSNLNETPNAPLDKVSKVFNDLKKELQYTAQTRRANIVYGPRPKSAVVWERTIQNLDRRSILKNRRSFDTLHTKSLESLKKKIQDIDSTGSNSYKTLALFSDVPVSETVLLLKTFAADTYKYIDVLKDIKNSLHLITELPLDEYKIFEDFVTNVNMNINLNDKVVKRLGKASNVRSAIKKDVRERKLDFVKPVHGIDISTSDASTVQLTRDQVINQLIKNKIMLYLKMKADQNSMTTNLARKILLYLEIGNDTLARELFKIFVSQNRKENLQFDAGGQNFDLEKLGNLEESIIDKSLIQRDPTIPLRSPKFNIKALSTPDQLMKQLLNIKNMRM